MQARSARQERTRSWRTVKSCKEGILEEKIVYRPILFQQIIFVQSQVLAFEQASSAQVEFAKTMSTCMLELIRLGAKHACRMNEGKLKESVVRPTTD